MTLSSIFNNKNMLKFRHGVTKPDKTIRKEWSENVSNSTMSVVSAEISKEYIIKSVNTHDEDMRNFLFTLGCYEGETITLVSIVSDSYVVAVKDARYSIDRELASAIII